jgi:hypothetical protein
MQTRETTPFSLADILGNVLALIAFVVLTTIGAKTIARDPKVGWMAIAVFGSLGVVMLVNLFQVAGRDEPPADEFTAKRQIRDVVVKGAVIVAAIFFGVADNFIADFMSNSIPRSAAVWLGTFVTTLAFYPLRGEQKKDVRNFRVWTIYCALAGVLSIGTSYFSDWLRAVMGH